MPTISAETTPLLLAPLLLLAAAIIGILPIKKLIEVREAKHELKHGSAGFIRTTAGWIIIAFWIAGTWFLATILGDWHTYGDLGAALDHAGNRLVIVLEILAALGDD